MRAALGFGTLGLSAALVLGTPACQTFLDLRDGTTAANDAATDAGVADAGASDAGATDAGVTDARLTDGSAAKDGSFLCQPGRDGAVDLLCATETETCCYFKTTAPNTCQTGPTCTNESYAIRCTSDEHCNSGQVCCQAAVDQSMECRNTCPAPNRRVCTGDGQCDGGRCDVTTPIYRLCTP